MIDVLFGHMGYPTKSRIPFSSSPVVPSIDSSLAGKADKTPTRSPIKQALGRLCGDKMRSQAFTRSVLHETMYLASDLLTYSSAAARKENIGICNVIDVHFYRFSS